MKLLSQFSAFILVSHLFINCSIAAKSSATDDKKAKEGATKEKNHKQTIEELRDQLAMLQKEIDDLKRNHQAITADADELESDIKTWRAKFEDCSAEESLLRESETYLKREKESFAIEASTIRQKAELNERDLKACQSDLNSLQQQQQQQQQGDKADDNSKCNCNLSETDKSQQSELIRKKSELEERMTNCEATVEAVRQRCAKDREELQQTKERHKQASENSESCLSHLSQCTKETSDMEADKKVYEAKVYGLEQKAKDANEAKEKSEKIKADALEGASRYYKFLLAVILFSTLGGSLKLYAVFGEKLRKKADSKQTIEDESYNIDRKKTKKKN